MIASIETLEETLKAIETTLATPAPSPEIHTEDPRVQPLKEEVTALTMQLTELQTELASLPKTIATQPSEADQRPVILAISLMQLEHAIETEDALTLQAAQEKLLISAKNDPYLAPKVQIMAETLQTEIPSREKITSEFLALIPALLSKRNPDTSHPLSRFLAEHVTIRRIQGAVPKSIDHHINQAELALSNGHIDVFMEHLEALKAQTELASLDILMHKTESYQRLQQALTDIRTHLIRHGLMEREEAA